MSYVPDIFAASTPSFRNVRRYPVHLVVQYVEVIEWAVGKPEGVAQPAREEMGYTGGFCVL